VVCSSKLSHFCGIPTFPPSQRTVFTFNHLFFLCFCSCRRRCPSMLPTERAVCNEASCSSLCKFTWVRHFLEDTTRMSHTRMSYHTLACRTTHSHVTCFNAFPHTPTHSHTLSHLLAYCHMISHSLTHFFTVLSKPHTAVSIAG
jgi:hypothetical protein